MTAARPSTTLPARLDSFVGRERELADTTRQLGESRLLTLVGPGGAGKTRLALRLAEQLAGTGLPTVTLVDLSSAVDGRNDPVQLTAAALGVRTETGHSLCETVIAALSERQGLLLFDNCEPVIADVAELLDTLLGRCPGIRVLATSQEAVGLPGEVAYPVGGLELSAADDSESAAARLFMERAREVNPSFVGNQEVAEICRRLDGLPLYLELAARWVNLLDTTEILDRLDDRFTLLTASARTATQRHTSLRAVIEWSYHLLDSREQEVFRKLSALPGGFDIDDAIAACGDSFQPDEVLHLIHQLQSKSLVVRREAAEGAAPLRVLESIRMFGAERLADAGELDACHDRLLDHYSRLCDDASRVTFRPVRISLRLKNQRDNLAAAVAWAVARQDDRAVLLASGLITSWNLVGWHDRGAALIASLQASLPMTPAQRCIAAHVSSWLAIELRDFATAEREAKVVLELAPMVDLPHQRLSALNALYWVAEEADDVAEQLDCATEAVTLAAELNDPGGLAGHQAALAWALWRSGERALAARLLDGIVPVLRQDPSRANLLRVVQTLRGVIAAMGGELDTAETLFRTESLAAGDADLENLRYGLSGLAVVAAARGQYERALRLAAAESALVARTMVRFTWIRTVEDAIARCRTELGPEPAGRAWEDGSRLSRDEAVAYGRDDVWPEEQPAEAEASPLSEREREIAELVAEGFTNREVAARLTLSPRTIESHLEHIRTKLGLRSRAHIAAWAAAQQA